MANPLGSFFWYELLTDDLVGATQFYGAVMGWHISATAAPDLGDLDYRIIGRADGSVAGGAQAIGPEIAAQGVTPRWTGFISVADVDATVSAITSDGGQLFGSARDYSVGRIATIVDPWGAPLVVMTPIAPAGQPDASTDTFHPTLPGRAAWNDYRGPDLAGAIAFYSRHFGWNMDRSMDAGEAGRYHFIEHGGQTIGGMMGDPGGPAKWTTYFRVPGTASAAVEAVEGNGGRLLTQPHEVPGGDRVFTARDPQDVEVGFAGS